MKIDKSLSLRIEILRFPLIVGIVFVHSYIIDAHPKMVYSAFISNFISEGIARTSVPLFFALSGYLLFTHFNFTFESYMKKIKNRIKTLLIPFLIWNGIIFLFYLIAQNIPPTQHYFTGERPIISTLEGFEYIALFFGIGDFPYPVAYQFWFIRDLIILVILTPVIYYFLKYVPYMLLGLLFIFWFFDLIELGTVVVGSDSLLFFSFGVFLGLKNYDFSKIDKYAKLFFILYPLLLLFDIAMQHILIHNFTIFIGLITVFCITKYLIKSESIKNKLLSLAPYSFFIFAFHEPMLSIVRKISHKLVEPQNDITLLTLYLLSPIVTIMICITIYKFLQKVLPTFLKISVGNR